MDFGKLVNWFIVLCWKGLIIKRLLRKSSIALLAIAAVMTFGSAASAATSTATLTGGTLSITAAASDFTYSGTLTGAAQNLSSSFALSVKDATGSKAGWNLQAAIGVLTAGTDTIVATNHTITGVTISAVVGTGPTNAIAVGQIPTTAAKIFNAAINTGKGTSTETFATQLTVPADAAAGTYTATLTVTLVSGP